MHPGIPKRKDVIKRGLVYALMSGSVIVIVSLLMLAVLGYSFKDRGLQQGGLLQFASIPSGATVTLDQMALSSRTPSKATADAATHHVTMNRDAYRTWQKSIDLKPGMIGWLSYTRLIPVKLKTEKLRTMPALAGALASPDRKWFALLEDASKLSVLIANVQNDKVEYPELSLPPNLATAATAGKPQSFSLDSWSLNGQSLLVKHSYDDDKTEWLVIDRDNPARSVNITRQLGVTVSKVAFAGRDGRTAFALSDGTIRRLNLNDQVISRPLADTVEDFSVFDPDMVLYTTRADAITKQRSVGYVRENMKAAQQLGTYADDGQPVKIVMSEYFGKLYVATAHGASVHITTGDLPREGDRGSQRTVATMTLPAAIERLSMGSNGRFVVAEMAGQYTTYDLELMKMDTTQLKHTSGNARPLKWIDPFMTWYDGGNMLRLYEFDGANQQDTIAVAEGYDAVIAPNDKYLYSIGRDGAALTLQRVRMVLN